MNQKVTNTLSREQPAISNTATQDVFRKSLDAVGGKLSLRVYGNRQGFETIRDDWLKLMPDVGNTCFYHHPVWFDAFLYAHDDELSFFCVYRNDKLMSVFPILWKKHKRFQLVELSIPSKHSMMMLDCALSSKENASEIYNYFLSNIERATGCNWDVFVVSKTLSRSNLSECFDGLNKFSLIKDKRGQCAVIEVLPYEQALRNMKKKFRGNLNNSRHRLAKSESAEFVLAKSGEELRWAFNEFINLEAAGWKGKQGLKKKGYPPPSAIALSEPKMNFYRGVVEGFSANQSAEINLLRVAGKTIGAQINILLRDVSYLIKTAYDESQPGYSPGHMLIDFAYKRYAEEGKIKKICLITDYAWFKGWNPTMIDYFCYRHFNKTIRGLSACAAIRLRHQWRRVYRTSSRLLNAA